MNLRQLLIERVLYAVDDYTLMKYYAMTEHDLQNLSDLDLLELYEEVVYEIVE